MNESYNHQKQHNNERKTNDKIDQRLMHQYQKLSVSKNLLCEAASTVRRVEDLIVEDGEVEGKPQSNGMSGCQISRGSVLKNE